MNADVRSELVTDEHHREGADESAIQRSRPAGDDHQQCQCGHREPDVGRRDETGLGHEQAAGDAGDGPGDHEGGEPVGRDVVADGPHPVFVRLDPTQGAAERRSDDEVQTGCGHHDHHQDVPEREGVGRQHEDAGQDVQAGDTGHAVRATGHPTQRQRQRPSELGDRQREHEEVDAAQPDGHEPHEEGQQRTGGEPDEQVQGRERQEVDGDDGRGVGPDPVVDGVPERGQPGVADQQVEARGEEAQDEDVGKQGHGEIVGHQWRRAEDEETADDGDHRPDGATRRRLRA